MVDPGVGTDSCSSAFAGGAISEGDLRQFDRLRPLEFGNGRDVDDS